MSEYFLQMHCWKLTFCHNFVNFAGSSQGFCVCWQQNLKSMAQKDSTSSCHQANAPNFLSPQHWASTSFQSPISHEVLSISSLVPSTVLTFIPQYKPTTNGNPHPEDLPFSDETPKLQPLEASPSSSVSSEAQGQKNVMSAAPCSDNPQEVQQRIQTDGGPLQDTSIGIMFPKELHDGVPGMVIIEGVTSMYSFDNVPGKITL